MADYAKKKNDELAALCKERGLPHTGKKADLVKRLEDHDAQDSSAAPAKKSGADDTIDWDDEPAKTATEAKPAEPAAKPEVEKASENGATTEAKTEDTAAAEKAPEFAGLGLQEASLDEEIAKRKKRAEKFGMDPSKDETLKLLERAKRFGTTNVPGLLNQALPEKAERNKKRGREGREDNSDRKNSRQRPNKEAPKSDAKPQKNGNAGWSDADREKMEKRKARFATASS